MRMTRGGSGEQETWRGHPERRAKAGQAFTLVEFLVVATIISILAAMLLPVLVKAVEASRQVVCIGNVKQLYFAQQGYADANHDYYPPWRCYNRSGALWTWYDYVVPYAGYEVSETTWYPTCGWSDAWQTSKYPILRCPKDKVKLWVTGWFSYIQSAYISWIDSQPDGYNASMKKRSQATSSNIMGAESDSYNPIKPDKYNSNQVIRGRHIPGAATYWFCDGHTEVNATYHALPCPCQKPWFD